MKLIKVLLFILSLLVLILVVRILEINSEPPWHRIKVANYTRTTIGIEDFPSKSFKPIKGKEPDYIFFIRPIIKSEYDNLRGGLRSFSFFNDKSDLPDDIEFTWMKYSREESQEYCEKNYYPYCSSSNSPISSCRVVKQQSYPTRCDYDLISDELIRTKLDMRKFKQSEAYQKWGKLNWERWYLGSQHAVEFIIEFNGDQVNLRYKQFATKPGGWSY